MAESDFSVHARAQFREMAQNIARLQADTNFPEDGPEKKRWYEDKWRRTYAAYVGDDIRKRCPCCGR